MRRFAILLLAFQAIFIVRPVAATADGERRPNVILILADDLGWSDTTLFGTTKFYKTPNIERLAKRGMTFRRAYAASPLCSPTRASILTGLSPARIGITAPVCHTKPVRLKATVAMRGSATVKTLACQSATRLKQDYFTLAEAMKAAGYTTGHFGKWHLGLKPYDALHHGFDVDVPNWPGPGPAGSYVAPWRFPNFKALKPGEHIEDRMGDEAVAFMKKNKDKPFFLNYWQFSVHAPFDAKKELIRKHRARVNPKDPQRSPTYAAMVESLDDNIGKMLDAVDRLGIAEKTIVIFFSDNGGNMYNSIDGTTPTSNAPLRGGKATLYEGGVRVPCIVSWPGVVKNGSRSDALIQSTDLYPTLLDMLALKPKAGQRFDGISIVPAFKGGTLKREAIYTYFPHSPRVPDHLPPAVAVHCGDWKLIRIFYGSDKQKHRYELYNLKSDIGERRNLAGRYPDRVKQLDALIDRFLSETKAVLPKANPAYDPGSAALAARGITGLRDCELKLQDGEFQVRCTGNDPHFSLKTTRSIPPQRLTLEIRMKSSAKGAGQVFWQERRVRPAFHRKRRVTFQPETDGKFHVYRVELKPAKPLVAVRIDPAQGRGRVTIAGIKLIDTSGRVVQQWPGKGKK